MHQPPAGGQPVAAAGQGAAKAADGQLHREAEAEQVEGREHGQPGCQQQGSPGREQQQQGGQHRMALDSTGAAAPEPLGHEQGGTAGGERQRQQRVAAQQHGCGGDDEHRQQ